MEFLPKVLPPVLTREKLQLILNQQEGCFQAERERERAEREDEVDALMAAIHDLQRNGDGTLTRQRGGDAMSTVALMLMASNFLTRTSPFATLGRGNRRTCSPLSIF